ncbi:MAG: S41 family peptidase [Eubacteriales bacterium]|nr:S41 family peptidase [Eubacteriales bacterium]
MILFNKDKGFSCGGSNESSRGKNRMAKTLPALLMAAVILFSPAATGSAEVYANEAPSQPAATSGGFNTEYFQTVMDFIKEYFNDGASDEQLVMGALKGLFGNLDQYSEFYTNEEAEIFLTEIEGEFGGIGISMLKMGDYIQVIQVFTNTPAERAGIVPGDRIATVDGSDIRGIEPELAAAMIRGEEGTSVILGIIKVNEKDTGKITPIELVREIISINPIVYEIRGDIAYIRIESFNTNTYENFLKAIQAVDAEGIGKIILDLRNNPGGYVDQAVAVARHLVPEGLITKLEFRSDDILDIEYYSDLRFIKYKIAVLVNSGTASASEILAGAMQDSRSGILVGTQTYGKAKIQNIIPILTPAAHSYFKQLLNVSFLNAYDLIYSYGIVPMDSDIIGWTKITTGEYLTPLGRKIGEIGLIPYMWADDPEPVNGVLINNVGRLRKIVKPGLDSSCIDVYNAEKILRIAGYDVGEPDMLMDSKTFEAVKQLQADLGLYSYGVIDFTTQQALNDLYDKLLVKNDMQYYWALEMLK